VLYWLSARLAQRCGLDDPVEAVSGTFPTAFYSVLAIALPTPASAILNLSLPWSCSNRMSAITLISVCNRSIEFCLSSSNHNETLSDFVHLCTKCEQRIILLKALWCDCCNTIRALQRYHCSDTSSSHVVHLLPALWSILARPVFARNTGIIYVSVRCGHTVPVDTGTRPLHDCRVFLLLGCALVVYSRLECAWCCHDHMYETPYATHPGLCLQSFPRFRLYECGTLNTKLLPTLNLIPLVWTATVTSIALIALKVFNHDDSCCPPFSLLFHSPCMTDPHSSVSTPTTAQQHASRLQGS
jgi:hypothetical protein